MEKRAGGSSLTFPVTLVEGDNGDVGRLLYKYIKDNVDVDSMHSFSDEEKIYILGYEVHGVVYYSESLKRFTLSVSIQNVQSVWLYEDGTIEIYWD